MSDGLLIQVWLLVLVAGLVAIVLVRKLGVSRSHARDLLHVGAGVWVLGWPFWRAVWPPIAITLAAAIAMTLVPHLSPRSKQLARIQEAISGGEERWTGVTLYTWSFAAFTALGLAGGFAFPAAAALLALAIGDGIGGAIGLKFGRRRYRMPWAKTKSLEGTLAVAVGATLGIALAAWLFDAPAPIWTWVAAGLIAGLVEAASPRASDNVFLPLAVFGFLALAT